MSTAREIRGKLPAWFQMRYDPQSAGWQLIDVIAKNIDDLHKALSRVKNQRYLQTSDPKQPYICYTGRLPKQCLANRAAIALEAVGRKLRQVESLDALLSAAPPDLEAVNLYHEDRAYIDNDTGTVYVRKPYDQNETYPDGYIRAVILGTGGTVVSRFTVPLYPMPLGTSLDELGLLLGVRRLANEDNSSLLLRIYAASRLPANSSLSGWIRGIARELGLFVTATWHNGGHDFLVPHKHVNRETIMVDREAVTENQLLIGENGQVAIKGDFKYSGKQRRVTYAYGIRIHELFNFADQWVRQVCFDENNFPTAEAVALKEEIDQRAPVKWNYFTWGDTLWDAGSNGVLPNIYDARVNGFVMATDW